MTTSAVNTSTPTRIFQRIDLNLEIETALFLEKFKQDHPHLPTLERHSGISQNQRCKTRSIHLRHEHSSTGIYIYLESALFLTNSDEWITAVSHSEKEELELIAVGFDLVRAINETTAIYKKRR